MSENVPLLRCPGTWKALKRGIFKTRLARTLMTVSPCTLWIGRAGTDDLIGSLHPFLLWFLSDEPVP